jgi:2-polyprenyl-3-methyl-5-hydroxy-6-metoxy-1,4-benzoquinol methylase
LWILKRFSNGSRWSGDEGTPELRSLKGRTAVATASDYCNYDEWKSWEEKDFFRVSPYEALYLSADFDGIDLAGRTFLEIGFGNGSMLAWAKGKGASIFGSEILESSLKRAAEKGIRLLPSLKADDIAAYKEFFDIVAAYDVFEHLTISELSEMLNAIASMLKPDGKLVVRFPNGQSPFGLMLQNADHTHRSALSVPVMSQVAAGTGVGLRIAKVTGGAQVPYGSIAIRLGQRAKFAARRAAEWYMRRIFDLNCELGNNLVMVLVKQS